MTLCPQRLLDEARTETDITITATGLTVQELLRVTVPNIADEVLLEYEANVANTAGTAQTSHIVLALATAGTTSALGILAGNRHTAAPRTNEWPDGILLRRSIVLPPNSGGDYIVAGVEVSHTGGGGTVSKLAASALSPGVLRAWRT